MKRAPTSPVNIAQLPGPDSRGNYWFDCGCMVNSLMQRRCPLHHAAPNLLAALEMFTVNDLTDERIRYGLLTRAHAAIAAVQAPKTRLRTWLTIREGLPRMNIRGVCCVACNEEIAVGDSYDYISGASAHGSCALAAAKGETI